MTRESDILLKAIMDGGKHSIIVSDRRGIVTFFNRAAERLYGHEAGRFVGQHISVLRKEIYRHDELAREAEDVSRERGRTVSVDEVFMVALERTPSYERERTAVRKDGTAFPVLVSVTAMRDETDAVVGYLSISQDISERKRLERMKSEFISTVSHELRTPLTSIRGALGLMAGGAVGELSKAASDLVALAYRNSERLVRIINDILDMEKVESGKFVFDIHAFDVVSLIRQSLEENRAYAERHGVRYVLASAPPSLSVLADPDRVQQVMANLLSNAAKFSPQGAEVRVVVAREERAVRVSVRDFGPGIPEAFRGRVFEKFAQGDASGAYRAGGTGLGLSITKSMVEAMGGAIGFETATGRGTTFFFSLPSAEETEESVVQDMEDAPRPAAPRILVCEDDRDVANLLKLLLGRAGYPVDVAHTLAAARENVAARSYAAMTLDLVMPDGDGLEFLGELRADPALKDLPVVVVSAAADDERRGADGHPVELVDWICKPIDEEALQKAIRRATLTLKNDNPRILHVEDNEDLRSILADLLRDHADLVGASGLREARELLAREPFDLIILDIGLPDGSGLELMEDFHAADGRPVPVMILSADEAGDAGLRKRVAAVLLKSRVSEEHVVQTVLKLLRKSGAPGIS